MSELDERRISEIAKEAPRVLRGAQGEAVRADARWAVEVMALVRKGKRGTGGDGGES
ncbi:hypothetical protein [Streptomyces parvus]|uniref:Uncharacterized protein n=1 Tax=Streptomyces parvus TaxID=66428 RepID=A0A7K3S2X7_9ACTN|nr:hypothetical protein [Streptomyces parvus]NEC21847.1 hypothetical protein [Streptomyces parvus]